jgi:hypothetical protein
MPENSAYYHAAYIAAGIIYGAYIVSLVIRTRRARERQRRREAGMVAGARAPEA